MMIQYLQSLHRATPGRTESPHLPLWEIPCSTPQTPAGRLPSQSFGYTRAQRNQHSAKASSNRLFVVCPFLASMRRVTSWSRSSAAMPTITPSRWCYAIHTPCAKYLSCPVRKRQTRSTQ